jgi:LysR family transcriptional regulator, hydrogen peroxide-inducible genes activator
MKAIPSLRQLRFLVAVVDRRHFGKAAEACFVGQSTLSAGIQELEDLLGVRLLERTKRSVSPTAIGLQIAERARETLNRAEEIVDLAQAAQDPMSGPLRLGMIPTIGPYLAPKIMPRLAEAFPKLKLYLREEQSAPLVERLEAGAIDAALLAFPYPLGDLETMEIGRDRFWVVCPKGHRLCRPGAIGLHEMATEDLLLLEEGHCLRDHALAACALEGAHRNIAFQGTSLHTLVHMVAAGIGVTLMPQMALDAGALRGLDLAASPLGGDAPWRRIGLAWRRSSGRKETLRRLGAVIGGCLGEAAAA